MKIIADQEARTVIEQMCDLSLKQGGLRNMQAVLSVLQSIEELDPKSVAQPEPQPTEEVTNE